jgi:hypothetical protein
MTPDTVLESSQFVSPSSSAIISSRSRSPSPTVSDIEGYDEVDEIEDKIPLHQESMREATRLLLAKQRLFPNHDEKVHGNIHRPEHVKFWMETIKPDAWTKSVLENGYKIPFTDLPLEDYTRNNKCALRHEAFVSDEIHKLVASGALKKVSAQPHCVSPLSVAERVYPNGSVKLRLCWDGSRGVNRYVRQETLHFSSLGEAADLMEEMDFQAIFDLKSAYHHIKIAESDQQFLGIAWNHGLGAGTEFYIFTVLPFGLKSAAHAITRLTRSLMIYFHSLGIRISIYIDDGRLCCKTLSMAKDQFAFVIATLQAAGFVISFNKSDVFSSISRSKKYLGFILDSVKMEMSVDKEKLQDVLDHISSILTRRRSSLKSASSVIGKIVALEPGLGPICNLLTRSLYWDYDHAVNIWGYDGYFSPSEDSVTELTLFRSLAERHNGFPIRRKDHYHTLHHLADSGFLPVVSGDASANMVCSHATSFFFQHLLTAQEQKLSSGHRELLTVLRTLQHHAADLRELAASYQNQRMLVWFTDSVNMVHFMHYGSRKPYIQADVLRIFRLCQNLGVTIHTVHLSREDPRIQLADEGTRIVDKHDWGLSFEDFQHLQQSFPTFTVDLFASPTNFKVDKYFSLFTWHDAAAVDAFTQSWDNEVIFACPPTNQIVPTWRRLQHTTSPALLIIPRWPAALFWPVLFEDGKHAAGTATGVRIFKPTLQLGQLHAGVMKKDNPFPFLAISFNHTLEATCAFSNCRH